MPDPTISKQRPSVDANALSAHVGSCLHELIDQGYAKLTVDRYRCGLGHFSPWSTRDKIAWIGQEEASVRRFLTTHLPSCDCSGRYPCDRRSSRRHCINCFARCEPVDTSQPATLVQARLKRKYNDLTPISRGSVASPPRPAGRERISFADFCPRASHAALSTSPIAVPSRFASLSQGPRRDGGRVR